MLELVKNKEDEGFSTYIKLINGVFTLYYKDFFNNNDVVEMNPVPEDFNEKVYLTERLSFIFKHKHKLYFRQKRTGKYIRAEKILLRTLSNYIKKNE